jgi:hypothetical protein
VAELTIVTPSAGKRASLAQCIAGIEAQTVPCIHRIVYNNAGDFGFYGRNKGARESTTPYIAFLDDDDWYEPDYARVMIKALKETGADAVYCRSHLWVKGTDEYLGTWFMPFDAELLKHAPYILLNAIVAKREFFTRLPFDETVEIAYNADWRMYLDAIRAGMTFAAVDVPLANYRVTPNAWRHWAAGGLTPAGVAA